MSTVTAQWVPVPSLGTADQISYANADYIVLDVLEQPIGGWVVVANAVDDNEKPAKRWSLVYANADATAQLAHREIGGEH